MASCEGIGDADWTPSVVTDMFRPRAEEGSGPEEFDRINGGRASATAAAASDTDRTSFPGCAADAARCDVDEAVGGL